MARMKALGAAALLGMTGTSWAQFVSLSGSVDIVARRDSGTVNGAIYGIQPGAARSSRLTLQSKEDLGGGFFAHAVLEGNFQPDTGTMGAGTTPFWNRVAVINIGSDRTGYLSLGRQFTPIQDVSASPSNDPFGGAWLGGIATLYNKTTNSNNGVLYHYNLGSQGSVAPVSATGFTFLALYAPGEGGAPVNGVPPPSKSGNQIGLGTSYGTGPVWFGAAYHQTDGNSAAINAAAPTNDKPVLKQSYVGAAYDFKVVRVHAGFNRATNGTPGTAAGVNRNAWSLGATIPVGELSTIRALYGKASDHVVSGRGLSALQLAYMYNLSKRTAVYLNGGRIKNGTLSSVTFASPIAGAPNGSTVTTLTAGVRHNF